MIYSSTIHFYLHPVLFNLSISSSCRVFSSMNLQKIFSYSKPLTSFLAVLLANVASMYGWRQSLDEIP